MSKATVTVRKYNFKNFCENYTYEKIHQIETRKVLPIDGIASGGERAYNLFTGRPYSYFNCLMLEPGVAYLLPPEIHKLGGYIKKGAKHKSIYLKWTTQYEKKDKDGNPVLDEDGNQVYYFLTHMKSLDVFAVTDCVFKDPKKLMERHKHMAFIGNDNEPIEKAEEIVNHFKENNPDLSIVSDENVQIADYDPITDTLWIPAITKYKSSEMYYFDYLRMICRSTGCNKRMNRPKFIENITKKNGYEELLDEMFACAVMNNCELETEDVIDNSDANLKAWVEAFGNDTGMLVNAGFKVDPVMQYVLNGLPGFVDDEAEAKAYVPAPEVVRVPDELVGTIAFGFDGEEDDTPEDKDRKEPVVIDAEFTVKNSDEISCGDEVTGNSDDEVVMQN